MPQFDPSTFSPQIFWLIVCFGFLFTLMAWVLVPRLSKVIETREKRIQEDLARAQDLLEEIEALRKEAHDRLYHVRHASREKYHEAVEAVQHERSLQLHNIGELAAEKLSQYFKNLLEERAIFDKSLSDVITKSVIEISPTLIGQRPTASALAPLVKSALKERAS